MSHVVVDKSYLRGASKSLIGQLSQSNRLLMTESLFYELITNEKDRAQCFSKLPIGENPVDLVMHVGGYLQKEHYRMKPAPKPSEAILKFPFRFHPALADGSFYPDFKQQQHIAQWAAEHRSDVQSLWVHARIVYERYPLIFSGSNEERAYARSEFERLIASSKEAVLAIYSGFKAPKGNRKHPSVRLVDESWFIYKWVQVNVLFAVDVAVRYSQFLDGKVPREIEEKLEHDVLDSQYLMIGAHQGSFAVEEAKLKRWFRLLQPNGRLYTVSG